MAKVKFSDKFLDKLPPAKAGKRYVRWDSQQPHLGIRVTDTGAKSFVVVRRTPGEKVRWHVIGAYPATTLKHAREEAPNVVTEIGKGLSPKIEKARRNRDTLAVAAEQFIKHCYSKGLRRADEIESVLRRKFLGQVAKRTRATTKGVTRWTTTWVDGRPAIWRERPVVEITRRDIIERLDEIEARGGKFAARHALAALRNLLNWLAEGERFGVLVSAAANVKDKTIGLDKRHLRRKRVLDDSELRDVWLAADDVGYPFGPLVRLLMLSGQRRNDVACARHGEIDLTAGAETLTVPTERYKTGVAQECPLPAKAVEIVAALPKFAKGDCAFTTTSGARPISGISKMKARLDEAIAKRRKKPMAPWTLHDLRRTVRTRLVGDCGVEAYIAERILGHALPGLDGVYDQGNHRKQKREALARWQDKLLTIVEPPPALGGKVVELRRRA